LQKPSEPQSGSLEAQLELELAGKLTTRPTAESVQASYLLSSSGIFVPPWIVSAPFHSTSIVGGRGNGGDGGGGGGNGCGGG